MLNLYANKKADPPDQPCISSAVNVHRRDLRPVSAHGNTQDLVTVLLLTLLLSGMIFPVESMPEILQYVSAVVPARWYISAVRKIMIMGAEPSTITVETCVLLAMTATLLAAALRNFKEHLK